MFRTQDNTHPLPMGEQSNREYHSGDPQPHECAYCGADIMDEDTERCEDCSTPHIPRNEHDGNGTPYIACTRCGIELTRLQAEDQEPCHA